jgi:hypothetical protein
VSSRVMVLVSVIVIVFVSMSLVYSRSGPRDRAIGPVSRLTQAYVEWE